MTWPMYSQYNCGWLPCDRRIQGNNNHGTDMVVPEYSGFSSGRDNILHAWKNGQHSADDIFKRIHLKSIFCILIQTSVKYVWVSNGLGDGWVLKTHSNHYLKQRWSSSLTHILVVRVCCCCCFLFLFLAGYRWEAMNSCQYLTSNYTAGAPITNILLFLAWISNHMPSKEWDWKTYPYPNFHGCTVKFENG